MSEMKYATVDGLRKMEPVPSKSRKRCHCGCKTRSTHAGTNNGIWLVEGCEMYVRRWVRDGRATRKPRKDRNECVCGYGCPEFQGCRHP